MRVVDLIVKLEKLDPNVEITVHIEEQDMIYPITNATIDGNGGAARIWTGDPIG